MSCEHTHLDGSYVLGALAPSERQDFERHLATCAECSRSVREMAGLPGLLSRIEADVLVTPPAGDPVPDTLLPALVANVRRTQRRRLAVTVGVAAAAAVVVGVAAVAGPFGTTGQGTALPPTSPSQSAGPAGRSMLPIGRVAVRGNVAFTSVLWGTRLDLTCTYGGGGEYGTPPERTYAMFVQTSDGRTEQVATWRGLPGRTMRLAAATAASRQDIRSVEVRTADGRTVLKLEA